jgi:hypothetical protein
MPPLLRRRAGRLGRMALETAYACTEARGPAPLVFCSRHGEVRRAVELLTTLAQKQPLSPANFSVAVHNAIAGLFSIAGGDTTPTTAVSAGAATAPCGIIEACGMLASGEDEVVLIVYDEPLPAAYQGYADGAEYPYAWAWRMTPAGRESIALSWTSETQAGTDPAAEPVGLQLLRCFLLSATGRTITAGGRAWHWSRHG